MFDVSTGAAYAVLYTVLSIFTILAITSAGYFSNVLPSAVNNVLVAHKEPSGDGDGEKSEINATSGGIIATDFFLSARDSTGTFGIAMSFFASGMGAWVVYGTTELGANPKLSWIGILGYAIASAVPGLFICWLGPLVKEATKGEEAFSTTDFCNIRYGRVMQLSCAAISVFYMWIFLVAEFTSISNIYATVVTEQNFEKKYTSAIAISIGVFTVVYTGVGGVPSSIITDKFQGVMMASLVLLLTISVLAVPENRISVEQYNRTSNFTKEGFYALVILFIAILSAELFNQATWQRVWASKDTPSLRKGFAIGSTMIFFLMVFFGIMGMIAYGKSSTDYDSFKKFAYLAFFDLLAPMKPFWHILTLILVTSLAASSVDSLQNGITSLLSSDLIKLSSNPELIKWMNRIVLVGVNIAAIVKSAERYDVLALFLVADLVCATSVLPIFMGLLDQEKFGILAPTELGAFFGCLGGIATVLVAGVLVDDMYKTKPFDWFWLKDPNAQCALCGTNRLWTFITVPIFSVIFTIVFTAIDLKIRGTRSPIIRFPFDEKVEIDDVKKIDDDIEKTPTNEESGDIKKFDDNDEN